MLLRKLFAPACCAALGVATTIGTFAIADSAKPADPSKKEMAAAQPEMKLPPGWTEADMQACMMAGMKGKMHDELAKHVGTWTGKTTMWMMPDAPPAMSECTSTVTSLMDGRYLQIQMDGEMPGMGPYKGFGLMGFDNMTQKFVATWLDNHSTGIMNGSGTLSEDGKTLTIEYAYVCPVTKKPAVMREVETMTSPTTKVFEMFGNEPKSGKEFKMMRIEYTKK